MTRSVAHVLWSGRVGGIGRLVCDLAGEQIDQGLDVTVAYAAGKGPFVAATAETGARVIDLKLRSGYDLRPWRIVRGLLVLRRVDVVHLHAFSPPLACIVLGARRPVVYTEHGNFGVGRRLPRRERVRRMLQRWFLHHRVSGIAAYSRPAADRLSAIYGLDSTHVTVVENGIVQEPEVVDSSRVRSGLAKLTVAFVGRFVGSKRIDRLIDAVAQAQQRDAIEVALVGVGPLEAELVAQAQSRGVSNSVRFLGYRDDLSSLLRGIDVFVQPGQGEQFGLAALEASSLGAVPVLFDDGQGGPSELPPDAAVVRSVPELAATLDGLVGSSTLSDKARRRRATWVRERFSISVTARGYRDLYDAAAEQKL